MYLLCALTVFLTFLAGGQTLITNVLDHGPGSLRDALANGQVEEAISFHPSLNGQTLMLESKLLVNYSVDIDASDLPDGLTIRGSREIRLFEIHKKGALSLKKLRLTGGKADHGGAFLVSGSLSLNQCHLFENSAGEGSAIFIDSGGSATIQSSTLAHHNRGGNEFLGTNVIRARLNSTLVLENSTLAENKGSAIHSDGTVTIKLSTISRNQVGFTQSTPHGKATIEHSIITGNGTGGRYNISGDPEKFHDSALTLLGPNLINGDAMIGPLADHGGFNPVMPPLPGSPASALLTSEKITMPDQLGYLPPSGERRAIGAVESGDYPRLGELISDPVVRVSHDQLSAHPNKNALSLREAIAFAKPGSVISFGPEVQDSAIQLSLGAISSERELEIAGPDHPGLQKIHGSGQERLFTFGRGSQITLRNLKLSHGADWKGGAINSQGILTASLCHFTQNRAFRSGGALYVETYGQADITNCIFDRNRSDLEGAAIYADGKTTICSSSVTRNRITYPRVIDHPLILHGAAVYAWSSLLAELKLDQVTVANNQCHGVVDWRGRTTLSHCTITSNRGRGFHNFEGSRTKIFSSIITENSEDLEIDPASVAGDQLSLLEGSADLLPLGFYGGPTETMPPRKGSPAINSGGTSDADFDQRGLPRSHQFQTDLGAVEYQGETLEWIAGFYADSDRDGVENGLESALGRDPFVFDAKPILQFRNDLNGPRLIFPAPSTSYTQFVSIQVLESDNLSDPFTEFLSNRTTPFEARESEIHLSLSPNKAGFYRLEATLK